MRDSVDPQRLTRSRRARLPALAMLISGVLVIGCGGSSKGPTAAAAGGANASAPSPSSTASATGAGPSAALALSKCMRANGVPNFPDPTASGNIQLNPGPGGINSLSPAFNAAWVKCQRLRPLPGIPAPGQTTHPSKQALAHLLRVSQCMRRHGISWFPDPRTSVPANVSPSEYGFIADYNGAILAIPRSGIGAQAPLAYTQATDACGVGPAH